METELEIKDLVLRLVLPITIILIASSVAYSYSYNEDNPMNVQCWQDKFSIRCERCIDAFSCSEISYKEANERYNLTIAGAENYNFEVLK